MSLYEAPEGVKCTVLSVNTEDKELVSFLFTLGLYSGECITLVKKRRSGCIINVNGARYSIDKNLACGILIR